MTPEHDDYLCKTYPKLFAQRNLPMSETCMCWGFACGDGWFNIIDKLCANIQHHIDWTVKQRSWDTQWNEEHPDEKRKVTKAVPQVEVVQVKEKFGGLRFYYHGGDERIRGMVQLAESLSYTACEICGSTAKPNSSGYIQTLCETHRNKKDSYNEA